MMSGSLRKMEAPIIAKLIPMMPKILPQRAVLGEDKNLIDKIIKKQAKMYKILVMIIIIFCPLI